MSVIFSGLERLNQGLDNQLNWFYFDVTDISTVNGEKNLSRLLIDEEHEILLFSLGPKLNTNLRLDTTTHPPPPPPTVTF